MKAYRKVLKNGLRIIVVPMKNNPTVTVMVLVEAGSHYERKENNGISHFLEHMTFKGTSKRPSALAIAHELDALGVTNNAFTSYEFTGYWAKGRTKHFQKIFDVISDMYLDPLFPELEMRKEKGVIIEEINLYDDQPVSDVHRVLDRLLYGDQPAGRSVLGTKQNIQKMKRDDFVSYYKNRYVPQATTMIVGGNIKSAEVFNVVDTVFGNVKKGEYKKKPKVKDAQRGAQVRLKYKKSGQSHFLLGFRSFSISDKRSATSDVLSAILGRGMSSRLFQKLREEMGVCYYVRADSQQQTDHGKFLIASGVDNTRIVEVIDVILDELRRLKDDLVGLEELKRVKEYIIGNFLMGLESSHDLTNFYGIQEIMRHKIQTPQDIVKEIKNVTPRKVQSVAQMIFQNKNMNLAIIGPQKNRNELSRHLKL